jgi:ribosomal protein L16 Arg81 hydroxylase
MTARFPTLARLVAPTPLSAFLDDYWEQRALHVRRAAEASPPLVTLAEIDAALSARPHRHPDVLLVDAARAVETDEYVGDEEVIDPVKLIKRFNAGATIVMNHLDESIPRVRALCSTLESELGILVQANLYLTPPSAQGFPIHYDSHDVIVVQCEGRKHWRLYDPVKPIPLPMRGERFVAGSVAVGPLREEFVLEPGDAIYVPRGTLHDAVADGDGISLHVTVGFHAVRWSEVLIEAIAEEAMDDPALRRGIALGALGDDDSEEGLDATLRAHAARVLAGVSWARVRERVRGEYLRDHKEGVDGMLVATTTAINLDTPLARRAGARVRVESLDDAVEVTVHGRATRWPAHARPALDAALARQQFTLRELGDALDARGWVTLAKRLIAEGALRLAD